ncbi:MAG: hypothetical protein ACC742_06485 [Thermoanaerobaculales bacterium]
MVETLANRVLSLAQDDESFRRRPQPWVVDMVGDCVEEWIEAPNQNNLRRLVGDEFTLVTARLDAARSLDSEELHRGIEEVYDAVLGAVGDRQLIRVWNFIPGILEPLTEFRHRYMVFNAGRFHAYSRWYKGRDNFDRRLATASGVGVDDDDFTVHALATGNVNVPVENPRQVSSYCYSEKYGSLPPCFARATRVEFKKNASARLLVGGTASICGETTAHRDDLHSQVEETLRNLASVVASGVGGENFDVNRGRLRQAMLARFRHLRVYCPHQEDLEIVMAQLPQEFENAERLEFIRSDLCRDGLLVEIEGWADVGT